VARSVAVELALCKPSQITVVGRTEARAAELVELLAGKLQVNALRAAWDGEYAVAPETAVVINATSIGREDDEALVPLKLASLRPEMVVADVTFNPPRTRLLVEAQQIGCTTIDGLDMFVQQTALCLQRWTGVEADRNVMREAVEEFLLL
jgi:shikimate dehydrogenase